MIYKLEKINLQYKIYGLPYIIDRVSNFLLKIFGLQWSCSHLLTQEIKNKTVLPKHYREFLIKYKPIELKYSDFVKGDPYIFNDKKLQIIKKRFESKKFKAFGILIENNLIYSCWLSYSNLELSFNVRLPLTTDALFLDDYCTPKYRGLGIHTCMNIFRLNYLRRKGEKTASVLVRNFNKPALKSQLTVGFKILEKIFIFKIFGHVIIKRYRI